MGGEREAKGRGGGFWESLSHDQVGCGDDGVRGGSEQGKTVGAAGAEVDTKHSVVKQSIGKLQQKSREKEPVSGNLETVYLRVTQKEKFQKDSELK